MSNPDEYRAFIDTLSGDGTDYAAEFRDGVIEGYNDLIEGRFVRFEGSLDEAIAEGNRRDREGW